LDLEIELHISTARSRDPGSISAGSTAPSPGISNQVNCGDAGRAKWGFSVF
jgi:hypothetical protein